MITIVKIGGGILDDPSQRSAFIQAFTSLEGSKMLVHGGGKSATELAALKGIPSEFVDGRRVTSAAMLEIAIMVYSGINTMLVAGLQQHGVNAIGLSGADDNCMPSRKRVGGQTDYGWVGDPLPDSPLSGLVADALQKGIVPVCAPLSWDAKAGSLLNTNADAVALFWVRQLQQVDTVRLIYAFGHAGVMRNTEDPDSLMPHLRSTELDEWIRNGTVHAGMIPKLDCGFQALREGAVRVSITAFDRLEGGTQLLPE